jgi:hypothetical protein
VTQNDRPSAFVDSPEDLITKARSLVDAGRLDANVAVLMTDIARELSKSREGHASRMSMVSANAAEMNELRDENKAMRIASAETQKEHRRMRTSAVALLVLCMAQAIILAVVAVR